MRLGDVVEGRFHLVRLAGAGGMGEIYEAVDQKSGRPAAIKAFGGHHGKDAARFAREIRVLSELEHPRIVRYLAHGALPSGEPYLAMEWLEGEDLSTRLSRGRLGAAESVALVMRVAEALGHAHARGVVHRDVKPNNIFLVGGRIDAVKVLDFGIAQLDAVARLTQGGIFLGTPGYMAPEQARGGEQVDARADVFSLGCVLFECLTGEPAFTGAHLMAVLARILFDAPARLRDRRPELTEALEALLDRMLAKSPGGRPRDGQAVAEALDALGEVPPTSADAPSRRDTRPTALTGSEQRAVAVILIGAPGPPGSSAPAEEAFRDEAEKHGGHFERLLDGSAAVMLASTRLATDLAAQAARCALVLRTHAPGLSIALALGRGEPSGSVSMGQAIDRAARLVVSPSPAEQGLAPVVLDETAAGLLDARFDVRESDAGFALYGERELAEGTRTLLGKATPCVGRDWELRLLEESFEDCVAESAARAMLITAPAGRGKSRLAQELLHRLRRRDDVISVWIGRGDALRAGSAFGMLGQAIRGASGIRDGEPLEVRRGKLTAHVASRLPEEARARVAAFVGEIIATPFPDEADLPLRAARRDAQLMNDQTRSAFLELLAAECAAHPVLILLEDLHWGDRPTVQLLDRALRDLAERPLFILAMARPEIAEAFPDLWSERGVQEIRLKELHRRAIERLARHVLGEGTGHDTLDRLARLSEGNAFYLEELIRREAEGRGADLPSSVVAMVQSRLGALGHGARRLLRAASVFGEVFWTGGVISLLGGKERAAGASDRIAELIDQEVILAHGEGRFPGEREYAFRHALLREGAHAMLTDEDRALGHRLAAEWLERHGEPDTLVLAEHFEQGGERDRAGHCYLRAAEQALSAGDATTALSHVRRGLAVATPEALRVRLLGALCEAACWHLESLDAALPDAEELLRIARPGSVPWVRGMFAKLAGAMQAGRFAELMAALGLVRETEISPEAAAPLALVFGGSIYFLGIAGQLAAAHDLQDRLAALARTSGDREPSIPVLWRCSSAMRGAYARNDPWGAHQDASAAFLLAGAIGHHRYLGIAQLFQGMSLWYLGAIEDAERTLEALSLGDDEISYGLTMRPFCLAWMFADRGLFWEAGAQASQLVAAGRTRRLPLCEALGQWALAESLRREGQLDAAEEEIHAALATLGMISPIDHPAALATLAALRLAQGRPAEALAAAEDGRSRAAAVGGCSFFFRGAFLRLTHAECLEATGDHPGARSAIAAARDELLAIAETIGDLAHRRTFLERVPENRRTLALAQEWLPS